MENLKVGARCCRCERKMELTLISVSFPKAIHVYSLCNHCAQTFIGVIYDCIQGVKKLP